MSQQCFITPSYSFDGNESNENHELFDGQLNHLADMINTLHDQVMIQNLDDIFGDLRHKLDKWRDDCYQTIDRLYEQKCQELDRCIAEKVDKQRKDVSHIRSHVIGLIHKHKIPSKDIDSLTFAVQTLGQEINETKHKCLQIDIRPLQIDENLIRIRQDIHQCNQPILQPPIRTMNYFDENSKILISNDRVLLMHQKPYLYLFDRDFNVVKEKSWTHGWIIDACWSTTLARFFLLTRNEIYLVDETTMSIVRAQKIPKESWWSCTCSDTSLYLSTKEWGSSIYEFNLWPLVQFIKQWESPDTCEEDEMINDIIYNKGTLCLLVYNRINRTKSIELRSTTKFNRLWSLQLIVDSHQKEAFRCCLFNYDQWLVIDSSIPHLFHITSDGKMESTCDYNPSPYRACLFGPNALIISTVDGVNLHKL